MNQPAAMAGCTTPFGPVRIGDYVHYAGSHTQYRGCLMEVVAIDGGGITLDTGAYGKLRRVRPSSVRPDTTT